MLTQLCFRGRVPLVLALLAVIGATALWGQAVMAHLKPRRSKCIFTAIVFGLLLALLALPHLVYGQGANATLLGTVTDASGAVVPGASVQVTNVDTGVRQTVTTDSQGRYTVVDLLVGNYEVQASAPGFQTVVRKGITTIVGSQLVVDIALSPGQ